MEALINMVRELKITSGSKKICKNSMVIRHSGKELLAKISVARPMKFIVGPYIGCASFYNCFVQTNSSK